MFLAAWIAASGFAAMIAGDHFGKIVLQP